MRNFERLAVVDRYASAAKRMPCFPIGRCGFRPVVMSTP